MTKLFAFWLYDLFPYVLGGEVTEMFDDGTVEVKGYGPGYRFTPFKVITVKTGSEMKRKLDALSDEYDAAQKKLRVEFVKRRDDIITVPGRA